MNLEGYRNFLEKVTKIRTGYRKVTEVTEMFLEVVTEIWEVTERLPKFFKFGNLDFL